MTDNPIKNFNGVLYAMQPIVCERHPCYDYENAVPGQVLYPEYKKVTIDQGMVTQRGLICPMCYAPARYATVEEAKTFNENRAKNEQKP